MSEMYISLVHHRQVIVYPPFFYKRKRVQRKNQSKSSQRRHFGAPAGENVSVLVSLCPGVSVSVHMSARARARARMYPHARLHGWEWAHYKTTDIQTMNCSKSNGGE